MVMTASPEPIQRILDAALDELELPLPNPARLALAAYVGRLLQWNDAFNLTALRDPERLIRGPVLEAIQVAPLLPSGRLLDVGTGGGLPGVPIAITQPERSCILMDANAKKVRFLRHVVAHLRLPNVEVVHARAEQAEPLRADVVTAKAVAELSELLPLLARHCAPGGKAVALKGPRSDAERAALPSTTAEALRLVPVAGLERRTTLVFHEPDPASVTESSNS